MKFKKRYLFILLTTLLFTCKKEEFFTDKSALLGFSTDTVTFDTIFTTIGSTTKNFRVYNPYNQPVKISSIYLGGGENSYFRLNIDGIKAKRADNVEIFSKDSLYIFVEVTLDPTMTNSPLIIKDSVIFNINGNQQNIKLIAFGQDVHLINNEYVPTQTWNADKPYLIYNRAAVDKGNILTLDAGTRVYFHGTNSSLLILGTLKVNGTKDNPVIFQGDRLEHFYDNISGQWGTIVIFPESYNNEINYAIIKNAIAGLQVGFYDDFSEPSVTIRNTIIQNASYAGIYAFGAKIEAGNMVFANCGGAAISCLRGGEYHFYHCTVSSSGDVPFNLHSDPSVIITNRVLIDELDSATNTTVKVAYDDDLKAADFYNNIIYGSLADEVYLVNNGNNQFNYKFDHCLLKNDPDSLDSSNPEHFNAVIFNENPKFISYVWDHIDLQLDTLSPAKDAGNIDIVNAVSWLEYDYNGNSRIADGKPDLGAYERIENKSIQ